MTQKVTIDYTSFDYDALRDDMIAFLNQTGSFKDANYLQSNIRTLVDLIAYIGAHFSYYINSAANEVFLETAKNYKNLNKIAQMLRYDPRGIESAKVSGIAALNPEYVYGKEGEYIDIPTYSLFPSTLPTKSNVNFNFTNPFSVVHLVKAHGINQLGIADISYKGYSLPFKAPKAFFVENGLTPILVSKSFSVPLSLQKPLTVLKVSGDNNYRSFDSIDFPLFNSSDSNSAGQPFINTIKSTDYTPMVPNKIYYLVLTWDTSTTTPIITFTEDKTTLGDLEKNILSAVILTPDATNTNYELKEYESGTYKRFYTGVLGMENLGSCKLAFDYFQDRVDSIQKIKLIINQDGNDSPLIIYLNGKFYTFTSGIISSQTFEKDFFSSDVREYFVNLNITNDADQENNYGAVLDVTTSNPGVHGVTIGTINTQFIDTTTGTKALKTSSNKRYGDFQAVAKEPVRTSEQKASIVSFASGETVQKIIFQKPFVLQPTESKVEYSITLTSNGNVRAWYTEASEIGFFLYIEPNTQFEGDVAWTATRIVKEATIEKQVVFDTPIPPSVNINGNTSNYMIQLTPNDNVEVWYETATTGGFVIKSEKSFSGKVSWSVFNYFADDTVPNEPDSGYKQRGRIIIPKGESTYDITLEKEISDDSYAIQLIPNKNIKTFYTNKTSLSFTINIETVLDTETTIDWYVDSSSGYSFQRHGEIDFNGATSTAATIPGFRFTNIPETFIINNLYQGDVKFSHINKNNAIDGDNNGLILSIDAGHSDDTQVRYIVNNEKVSTNGIRIFVKNAEGSWDEWKRAGTAYDTDIRVGEQIFYAKLNPEKLITIEFGDGETYGRNPQNREMFIIGLDSVGSDGNINKGTLNKQLIVSKYILGNDRTDIQFEADFISLLGLKSVHFFNGSLPETSIIDSEGTKLNPEDLEINQNVVAFGGSEIETIEELRRNATNYFTRQGRNVSLEDTRKYVEEVFSDYVLRAKVISYEDAKKAGVIAATDQDKYWFNYVFVFVLNRDGSNIINKNLNDLMVSTLDSEANKVIGKKHVVYASKWMPIDVIIRYKKKKNQGNPETIEAAIRKAVTDFFHPENRNAGETINNNDIVKLASVDFIESLEVMINKDPDNKFNKNDYIANIPYYSDTAAADIARKNKLMQMITKDPSLVKVFQPLFGSLSATGAKTYNYSLNIILADDEFPKLSNIIIERQE